MAAPKEKKPYTFLHPELAVYNDDWVKRFITPNLHDLSTSEKRRAASTEVAEQLYHFRLFTDEFCKLLIEECENCGKWVTNLEKQEEDHPFVSGLIDVCEPDTTIELKKMPGMTEVYAQIIKNHVQPLMEEYWVTFKLQKWDDPAVRRYSPDLVKGMDLHYDLETISMVGYLNKDFIGGGTWFPRWKLTVGNNENVVVGSAVIYPGGVSHEHSAHTISEGKRYCFSNSFY